MNGAVKVYASELYERVRSLSGQSLHADRASFAQLVASRRTTNLPLSGPEFQNVAKMYGDHVSRCIRARFDAYRQAYREREITPNDQELREIMNDVMAAKEQEVRHSATSLQQYAQANGLTTGTGTGIDPAAIIARFTAVEYERVVNDWKVWKAEIKLKADSVKQNEQHNQPTPKSSWKAVFGLIWSWGAVVVIAGILFSFVPNAVYAGDVIGTVAFCALGFGVLVTKFLTWERMKNLRFRGAANTGVITAATILLAVLVTWTKQRVPQAASMPLITMQISPMSLPISIPSHTVASILQIHPYIGMNSDQDGLLKVANDTGTEGCWPKRAELATLDPNQHEDAYRLEITNHSNQTVENGKARFGIKYNTGKKGTGCTAPTDHRRDQEDVVLIPPLDPGKSFEFYAINPSNSCAWLLPPDSASVKMAGQDKETEVHLALDKNPLYSAGAPVFSPSGIKWSGIPTHPNGFGVIRTGSESCEATSNTASSIP